eukprot:Awhi_evm1s10980
MTEVPDPATSRNQTRHPKNSMLWLLEVYHTQTIVDPSNYLYRTKGGDICFGPEGTSYTKSWMYSSECSFKSLEER